MPFPDESHLIRVEVHQYRDAWRTEAIELTTRLKDLVLDAVSVEHIGSTSIPGMAAKDCLDMMVLVTDLATTTTADHLVAAGYRRRTEVWNNSEPAAGRAWPKMVFAPPVGARAVNIHVRTAGGPNARIALLFRDYLRSHPEQTQQWSALKSAAANAAGDLASYGSIKAPAWQLLMELAERWAAEASWVPDRP